MLKQKQKKQEDTMKQKQKEQEQVKRRSRDSVAGGAVTVGHNVYTSLEQHQSNYTLELQVPFIQAPHFVPQNRPSRYKGKQYSTMVTRINQNDLDIKCSIQVFREDILIYFFTQTV